MKTLSHIRVLILCVLLSSTFSLSAKTIYVDGFANGGDGSSWDKAFTTITAALDAATSGDEIWVASDTYMGQYIMKSGVNVYGGFDTSETSRDQRDFVKNRTILKNTNALVLKNQSGLTEDASFDGFDIRDVRNTGETTTANGGAGYLSAKMNLRNCRILNNISVKGTGGGISMDAGATIENCIFAGNSSQSTGGAINMNKGGVVKNCIFINNFTRGNSGGGIAASTSADGLVYPTIENCLFAHNEAYNNGGAIWSQGAYINNCTMVNNKSVRPADNQTGGTGNGGAVLLDGITKDEVLLRKSEMYNCILWGNDAIKEDADKKQLYITRFVKDGEVDHYKAAIANCAIQNLDAIKEYPLTVLALPSLVALDATNNEIKFASPNTTVGVISPFDATSLGTSFDYSTYTADWSIGAESAAVNKGDNSKVQSTVDLNGTTRIMGDAVDLGAYEAKGIVSITENPSDIEIQPFYVSPDRNTLFLTTIDDVNVEIYSISGASVISKNCNGSLDISNLTHGTYIVKTGDKTGKIIK